MNKPILWHSGLYIKPQHFQLADLYAQSLQTPFYKYLAPYFWGTIKCEIRESSLSNLSFKLLNGEYVFPDMTYAIIAENPAKGNACVDARVFNKNEVEGDRPLTVYLGIKNLNLNKQNVTKVQRLDDISEASTRFVTTHDSEDVADIYIPRNEDKPAPVNKIFLALKLFWETEKDSYGDYSIIPIAQLERKGENIGLSQKYIPPCLSISSSESLKKIVAEIREDVTKYSKEFEHYKRKGTRISQLGTQHLDDVLALRTLNRYVPTLHHFSKSEPIHPWIVFGLLRQLIGEISSFSNDIDVMGFKTEGTSLVPYIEDYHHDDLSKCFSDAHILINEMLGKMSARADFEIKFEYKFPFFEARLPAHVFEGKNEYYLVLQIEKKAQDVVKEIKDIAKLGPKKEMGDMLERAIDGIPLTHIPIPSSKLPNRSNGKYFLIDIDNELWLKVKKDQILALHWSETPQDLHAEIIIISK